MKNDSISKTIIVALGVCLVCSVLVSSAAVFLKPTQEQNKKLDKIKNILAAGDLLEEGMDCEAVYKEKISAKLVDLTTGEFMDLDSAPDELKPENYDIKAIQGHSEYGMAIAPENDLAKIQKMPKDMLIYCVNGPDGGVDRYILPLYGKGLWSTMYGLMALDKDLQTVKGFTFYEHGETPGLGGEVDNPRWKESWKGKKAFNENGKPLIEVLKGLVDQSRPDADHQIDGLSGSTLTTRGIDNTMKFWLGEFGYGKFLDKLREVK